MAGIIERVGSRKTTVGIANPSVELLYAVRQTENEAEVRVLVESEIPYLYNLLSGLGVQQLVFQDYTIDDQGGGLWDVVVKYAKREQKQAGESSFAFDTTGGTAHITQALETVAAYAHDGTDPPDMQETIGFNGEHVEGTDIVVPAYAFSETHYFPAALVTGAYKTKLHRLTGKVNNAVFTRADGQVFAIGECQFLGASGSQRGLEDWEITFKFTGSPNANGIVVGPLFGISKRGFEYLWVRYRDYVDEGCLVKQPAYVYVNRVIEYGNFADIGIGT